MEPRFCLSYNDARARVLRRQGERYLDSTVREIRDFGVGSVCAEKSNTDQEVIEQLHSEINKLKTENIEKDAYILKIKRDSKNFENDVYEVEHNYVIEIEEQKLIINNLRSKVDQISLKKSEIEEELSKEINNLVEYKKEINELRKRNGIIKKCTRKVMCKAEHPEMEDALYTWFLKQRGNYVPISSEILRTKAKSFYKEITGKDDFSASSGWLDKLKS
ncbi:hypothetical protein NQ314_019228 [Rhamnusium bicolor]|uniref:HTH CENPB-type domain-containing protein n=1 Tax=Rhamnusium bicolor TaxID=1586634 RepID=A0AAV8WP91_9CUCU|nr:hypothetical protein NQ314_019228 [Rhamnusium bicolor]